MPGRVGEKREKANVWDSRPRFFEEEEDKQQQNASRNTGQATKDPKQYAIMSYVGKNNVGKWCRNRYELTSIPKIFWFIAIIQESLEHHENWQFFSKFREIFSWQGHCDKNKIAKGTKCEKNYSYEMSFLNE